MIGPIFFKSSYLYILIKLLVNYGGLKCIKVSGWMCKKYLTDTLQYFNILLDQSCYNDRIVQVV